MSDVPRQTRKYPALSQVIICAGGSCTGKEGGARSPKQALLDAWKRDYLWRVCHVSFSDCLGPCDTACNAVLMTEDDTLWLGGLTEGHFPRLTAWVRDSLQAGHLLPFPQELQAQRSQRFAGAGTFPLTRPRRKG